MEIIELNTGENFKDRLFFWIRLYLRKKMITSSNRLVIDKNSFKRYFNDVNNIKNIDEFTILMKNLAKIHYNNLNSYFYVLQKLYYFLMTLDLKRLEEINEDIISDFLSTQEDKANSTRKIYRMVILNFFKFIELKSKVYFGIELNIKNITSSNGRLPRYLTKHELKKINLNLPDINPSKTLKNRFIIARNRLILKLLLFSGIRSCEIAVLNERDIEEKDGFYIISILGKCNKHRNVMIKTEQIKKELETYLELRENILKQHLKSKTLFISNKGNCIHTAIIYSIVRNSLKNNSLLGRYKNGGHLIRHSYASLIYNETNDILLLQRLLGHSSIETTKIYTHLDNKKIIAASNCLETIC